LSWRVGAACLAIAACIGLGGCGEKTANATPDVASAELHKPTQVLKDFEMTDSKDSVRTMTLRSIEGRIYEAQNVADVDQPFVLFYTQGVVSSRIKAPVGRVQMDTHEVEMWGGVTVVSSDSSTLTTERLRYDPKKRKIFSKDAVHLEKTDSITDGIGLETDPELKSVKIGRQKVRFKKGTPA